MADYLYNVPRDVLIQMLRSESKKQGYTDAGARVSLLLDIDAGKARSRAEYARLWGWTPKYLRLRWDAILADVLDWATAGGRQSKSEIGKKARAYADEQERIAEEMRALKVGAREGHEQGHGRGTETGLNGGKNTDQGHARGPGRAREGHDILYQPSSPTGREEEEVRAGAREAPADRAFREWNELASRTGLPAVRALTDKRRAAVKQRLPQIRDKLPDIYAAIERSAFLCGSNDRGWKADFDFLWLKADAWAHILEGKYDDRTTQSSAANGPAAHRRNGARPDEPAGSEHGRREARDNPAAAHARILDIARAALSG